METRLVCWAIEVSLTLADWLIKDPGQREIKEQHREDVVVNIISAPSLVLLWEHAELLFCYYTESRKSQLW